MIIKALYHDASIAHGNAQSNSTVKSTCEVLIANSRNNTKEICVTTQRPRITPAPDLLHTLAMRLGYHRCVLPNAQVAMFQCFTPCPLYSSSN